MTHSFAKVALGQRVTILVGGRADVQAIGVVQEVTNARFRAQFPAVLDASINTPFQMTFRKSDGRSVGGRLFKFAEAI